MIKPQIIERQQVPEDVPLELLQSLELLPPSKMQFSIEGRQEYRKSKKEYTDYLLQGVTYRKYVINGASLSLIDKNVPLIPQEFLDEIWEKCGGSKDGRKSAMARSLIKIKKGNKIMNELAVSVNQLEVKKEKIAGVVKDFLAMQELVYRVPMPDKDMVITNPEEMKLSELNVKFATTELSRILEHTTKAKQIVDGFKAPILALEKEITAKADSVKAALKTKQQAYLLKVKKEQDAINGVVNMIRKAFHDIDIAQKTRDALLNKCMTDLDLGVQEIAIRHTKVPKAQKAEVKEILEEIQMKKEATIQVVEPEFVQANVVQTRAIEEKYTYSIADEKAYVKYCVENGLWESNLTIKPNMNMFKAWVKMSHPKKVGNETVMVENNSLPFIGKTLDLK